MVKIVLEIYWLFGLFDLFWGVFQMFHNFFAVLIHYSDN